MAEQPQPTPEDMQKMKAVADEGAKAAAEAPNAEQATVDAKAAMKAEAEKQQLAIPDEQIDQIADAFVGKTIAAFEQRGAFDPAPEPVTAPATPAAAPPAPSEQQAPPVEQPEPVPQKRTWAERFLTG